MINKQQNNIFGFAYIAKKDSKICIWPIAFAATTSFRQGTQNGPKAIYDVSEQVDLCDIDFGDLQNCGILWENTDNEFSFMHTQGAILAKDAQRAASLSHNNNSPHHTRLNDIGHKITQKSQTWSRDCLNNKQIPVVIGGDHSIALGNILACQEKYDNFSILHLDAHCDLRKSYDGFVYSHASIMYNAIEMADKPFNLVQVGIRDFCDEELTITQNNPYVMTYFDQHIHHAKEKSSFATIASKIIDNLSENVYLSCDIDAFEPHYCPNTGTPVPGGLNFAEFNTLLNTLIKSNKKIIGADLCEVAPSQDHPDGLDAIFASRVLYKILGSIAKSNNFPQQQTPTIKNLLQ